SRHT
ncbi:hypothetical protein AB1N83_013533, partial [Pleurotus pulmonarius]